MHVNHPEQLKQEAGTVTIMVMLVDLIANLLIKDAFKWQYPCPRPKLSMHLLISGSFMESAHGHEIDFPPVTVLLPIKKFMSVFV